MVSEVLQKELGPLREALHGGRNMVLPVVGAGLSIPVPMPARGKRLPLWKEMLEELIGRVTQQDLVDRLRQEVAKDKYLDVASALADELTRDVLSDYLARTFQKPPGARPKIYDLVARLPVDHFATTNFDPWLGQAVSEAGRSGARILTPGHTPSLHDVSLTSLPFVFMLHGDARTPQECVLTLESFAALQFDHRVYMDLLAALANQRTLLFLGYSLTDPDLLVTLASWQARFANAPARHVLLATDVAAYDRTRLRKYGVQVVEYAKGKDYAALAPVLEWLATPPQGAVVSAAADSPTRYLESLLSEVAYIELRNVNAGRAARGANQVPIERLYTQLTTTGFDLTALGRVRVPLTDHLFAHERLLIEGQPGSGKTTLVRYVVSLLARDRLGVPCPNAESWREHHLRGNDALDKLPVFVRAAELVERLDKANGGARTAVLLDHLAERWPEADSGLSRAYFERALRNGDAVLFLDGLDEVADPALRSKAIALCKDLCGWKCRIVVTSRPIATEELQPLGFARVVVEPFDTDAIATFIDLWVRALYDKALDAQLAGREATYHEQLRAAIIDRARIRRLAQNPVMLTCLAIVHWNEGDLPEGRSRVYRAVLKWLLLASSAKRKQEGYTDRFAELAFQRLALAMMAGDGKRAVIDLQAAAEAVEPVVQRHFDKLTKKSERLAFAREWLRFEALHSGILQELARNQLRFWHLTFQEYLAAAELAMLGEDEAGEDHWWPMVRAHLFDAQWRESVEMLPCCLLETSDRRVDLLLQRVQALRGEDSPNKRGKQGASPALAQEAKVAALLGRLLQPLRVLGYTPAAEFVAAHHEALQRAEAVFMLDGAKQVPWRARIDVAEELGRGGDRRIAPGSFNYQPIGEAEWPKLGVYPVTVMEYQEFVDDGGYDDRRWWSEQGWTARDGGKWSEPGSWDEQLDYPNRPVTEVSWFEAEAYCAWMTDRHTERRWVFRLPTNAEWEMAAGGAKRPFPWGDAEPDAERANFDGKVGARSPVGVYPTGAGLRGHLDLAGNVWEWSADSYEPTDQDRKIVPSSFGWFCLRGGGWGNSAESLRVGNRLWSPAGDRNIGIGFRVAIARPSMLDS